MWIHLLTLQLIDGAGGETPPEPPAVVVGGHYYDFWHKKYIAQWEKKDKPPKLQEVIEYVKESPEEALSIAKQIAPEKTSRISVNDLTNNISYIKIIAKQIIIQIKIRQLELIIKEDDDDIEAILLLM